MHSRESLPDTCLQQCVAANNEQLCEVFNAFSPECAGPEPSDDGKIDSQVQIHTEQHTAYSVPKERDTRVGILVCRNIGLNNAVKELVATTNEQEGRLF